MKNAVILSVACALLNAFMLASMSLFAKLLATYYGPVEVTFFRNAFSLVALFIWIIAAGKLCDLRTKRVGAHLFRGAIGTIGIVLGAWALALLPLAETTILLFTSPLWTVLLSYPVLKERVGFYRLSAVLVGMIGVWITVSPSTGAAALPVLGIIVGLSWGFFSGCVDICLRWMGNTENSTRTVFYFVLFGTITTGMHWPYAEVKVPLDFDVWWIIVGLGGTGLVSLLAKTQSYRLAEASIIAPVMYTMIIWTFIFDYALWHKEPSLSSIIGASLIIASNLFILYRERKKSSEV